MSDLNLMKSTKVVICPNVWRCKIDLHATMLELILIFFLFFFHIMLKWWNVVRHRQQRNIILFFIFFYFDKFIIKIYICIWIRWGKKERILRWSEWKKKMTEKVQIHMHINYAYDNKAKGRKSMKFFFILFHFLHSCPFNKRGLPSPVLVLALPITMNTG